MTYDEESLREFGKKILLLAKGHNLSRTQTKNCYKQIILDEQPALQQGAFLVAHFIKGPSTTEMSGAWDAMMEYDMEHITPDIPEPSTDIVGTGSDALKTVNVSTPAALIASACGLYVAKKGARLVTGVSGATCLLEAFGLDLEAPLTLAQKSIEKNRIGYLPGESFLKAGWGRLIKVMRFTSVFNVIGPITMPCNTTKSILVGVYAPELGQKMVDILNEIGFERALSVYGMSDDHEEEKGIDEISVCGPTRIFELKNRHVETYMIYPSDFGVTPCKYEDIASAPSKEGNVAKVLKVIMGKDDGPVLDFFCVNAAALLYVTDRISDLKKAMDVAKESVATGKAIEQLRKLVAAQSIPEGSGLGRLETLISTIDAHA